ncbi:GNAT family N-acetyltransferase [Pseudonocardia sp. MH-G8]|uniref:GNAT family N-acetyltransferase n=1 Tax=Pseudonocardia sp. MH-G8 TaxID=1854588 RepID=UPI000BA18A87|nr:GNAT family N-acetyltransferase [Pseudonocardia sp. MH-G8]OZM79368.1 cellulose biosynthesis protein CelD [Pseudonocardia sp. MH-G8]
MRGSVSRGARGRPVRPEELGAADVSRWRELQHADPALTNPFLAPEYAIAVGAVRPQARVAVLDEGFFAFEDHGTGIGLPLGAGLSDQQAVIGGKDVDARELAARCGVHAQWFEHVPEPLLPDGVNRVVRYPSPVIDLSEGYEAFFERRRRASKSLVPTMQRKRRKMEREIGPTRFVFASNDRAVLRDVMRWKSQRYAELGAWDRFAAPSTIALVEALHTTQAPGCSGTLSVLYAGDEVAAAHFGLRSEQVLTSWFPTYNPEFGRYSPGLLLHFLMAEAAAECGMVAFDLGAGDHGYKDVLRASEGTLARGWAFRGSAAGIGRRVATAPGHGIRSLARRSPRVRMAMRGVRDNVRAAGARLGRNAHVDSGDG